MATVADRPVSRRLFERATRGVGKVDEVAGILYGVKLVGPRGNRDYPASVLQAAVSLYKDRPVYIEHADQRGYGDRLGFVRNPRFVGDSIYGDVHLNVGHPLYKAIMHDAKTNPNSLGMSHTARGVCRYVDGRQVCERIESIESVDLCLSPASTRGLFEAKGKRGMPQPKAWHFPRSVDEFKQRLFTEQGTANTDLGEPVDGDVDDAGDDSSDEPAILRAIQSIVTGSGSDTDKVNAIKRALGLAVATDPPVAPTTVSEPAETTESIEDFRRRVNGKPSIQETKAAIRRLIR